MNKLKIGVLGAGHLGKIHIRCIREIESYQLMGFYDPDEQTAAKVSEDFSLKAYHDIQSLIDDVDVVDIVTPTVEHFPCASRALRESRHVFIEKPIVATPDEARELMKLAYEANVKVQVGHVEGLILLFWQPNLILTSQCLLKLTDSLHLILVGLMCLLSLI
jgi:predicted dehydrogenase